MKKTLALGAALAATLVAGHAGAAVVTVGPGGYNDGYATTVTYNNDNQAAGRSTANDRANASNALGATDGNFFEIGYFDEVIFTFGTQFQSPATVTEVTFGNRGGWVEMALVYVGNLADPNSWTLVNEAPISNANPTATFTFNGIWDAMKFVHFDTGSLRNAGSFDIDSVRVAPVPLPATGLLLLGALGGVAALRRRQRA
ncbi:MAG: VPLPA-CTERM sorting domain-containing protein [Paracoccus sp. (in: a-proteobacteria)]|uniref:VPLPA-CTERM sorting domain-containing protein n=1 Tax=Paracoccus sp. TaxID=267 RepID=UPI0026E0167F|nr:VPLPA-CTERM sorting domain-containing protein [Paracoccus sp. (in: a-proteobacteria)]MDO5630287.1 VPLPA-CTERM sorting domain-containing protein [Paracoccus sp. (in: a-proteobacteria)]